MEAYTGFAQVYDTFMDDTPYEEWCAYLVELLDKYGDDMENDTNVIMNCGKENTKINGEYDDSVINKDDFYRNIQQERNSILDLGCGTGTLTELLAERGYDMIGIDNSEEMLQIAMDKRDDAGLEILYLLQDMRSFELYGTVGAVISVCDSVNYLLEEEDVVQTFRLVNNYLYPGGLFIFDFNTVYKYEVVIGDHFRAGGGRGGHIPEISGNALPARIPSGADAGLSAPGRTCVCGGDRRGYARSCHGYQRTDLCGGERMC